MGVHEMEVCSKGHVPIVHTEGYKSCPLCAALERLNSISKSITVGNFAIEGDLVKIKNIAEEGITQG